MEFWLSLAHKLSEAEQLLGQFQFNLLFALYPSSSSNLYCKVKLTKVTADVGLDTARFLVTAHRKWVNSSNLLFAVIAHGMGKEGQGSSGLMEWKRKAREAQASR